MSKNAASRDDQQPDEAGEMARADMRRIAQCKRELETSRLAFLEAIKAAVASGETYRDVGRMAGLSHQRIHQIVTEEDVHDE
jgi:catalase (peroxidase I)